MAYAITKPSRVTKNRSVVNSKSAFATPINKPIAQSVKSTSKISRGSKKPSTMTTMPGFSSSKTITPFQKRVYELLLQIPAGKVSTYAALSKSLDSSPRAVGGALRNNPFAPEVPCHRVVASTGYIGGFMGDWQKAPSGINQNKKLALLTDEGVSFDEKGMLLDRACWWDDFSV